MYRENNLDGVRNRITDLEKEIYRISDNEITERIGFHADVGRDDIVEWKHPKFGLYRYEHVLDWSKCGNYLIVRRGKRLFKLDIAFITAVVKRNRSHWSSGAIWIPSPES